MAGSRYRSLAGLLLMGLAGSLVAQPAQQADETLPGFKTNNLLEAHGIDNINLFNGDPGVAIPLGPSYPLGPGSTFQLQAHYSNKFWHFDSQVCQDQPDNNHAVVSGYSTLGMGWTLELGYIGPDDNSGAYSGYYHSPDGGRHPFNSSNLQPPFFTVDHTHLRVTPNTPSNPTSYTVEFQDGSIQTFAQQYTLPGPFSGTSPDFSDVDHGVARTSSMRFGLTQIKDAFGAVLLTVNYAGPSLTVDAWRVSSVNLVGRSQPITYNWTQFDVFGVVWWAVASISFPSTAGQTANATFTFSQGGFSRNAYDNSAGSFCATSSSGVSVPLLSSIVLSSLATYRFGYVASDTSGGFRQGALNQIFLPTNSSMITPSIQYAYDITATRCNWQPGVQCADPETGVIAGGPGFAAPLAPFRPFLPYLDKSAGIATRTVTDITSGVSSVTNYTRQTVVATMFDGTNWVPDDNKVARGLVVSGPSGNGVNQISTRYVFHTQINSPFLSSGAEIARRYYPDGNSTGTGTPIRAMINCYEADPGSGSACGYRDALGQISLYSGTNSATSGDNFRRQGSITWYGVNPMGGGVCPSGSAPCTASLSTAYNPLAGKYATTTVTSTLKPMPGWSSRASTTVWNPQIDATHWLLNLFDSKSAADAGAPSPASVLTSYTFNRNNGFLLGDTSSDGYGVLTHSYCNNGDCTGATGSGTATPITMSGTGGLSGSFTDTRTFQNGVVKSAQRSGITWKSFDVDRDPNTGLVTTSRDPNASLQTAYGYDALGRVSSIIPPGVDAPTTISYDTTNQKTTVSRAGSDGNGTWQQYLYDSLGRLIREIRQMPAGSATNYALRVHGYDTAGHANVVSEWGGCGPAVTDCAAAMQPLGTTSSNFDPLGRAQAITRADGTSTTIDRADGPIQFSDSLESVTVTINGASTTATRKDALGRVITVTEPSVGQGIEDTTYTYNVLDKLAGVTQGSQTRTFAYDAFGFLRSETTPEKGTVTYSSYDALGGVGTEIQTDGTQILRVYDLAGRLQKTSAGGFVFLRNCYDGPTVPCVDGMSNPGGGSYPNGKLTDRYGYNPGGTPALRTWDDFIYSNSVGRLSSQTTSFDSGALSSATQSWIYNSLGLIAQHAHARASGAPLAVTTSYSQGLPTTEYANGLPIVTGVGYSPSGALSDYTTGPGIGLNIATTISPDTSGIVRPARIYAQPVGPYPILFDTNAYAYDGAGNITAMGSDSFTYDARSRLCKGILSGNGSQFYTYDRFGNMVTKGFNDPGTCWSSTSWSNNRVPTATYDMGGRGNLVGYAGATYSYDSLDRLTSTGGWSYLFDGASERTVRIPASGAWTYTFRDEGKRLSTEFAGTTPVPSRDNIFLGNLLVASYGDPTVFGNGSVWAFYSSDHLGTPRLITDVVGASIETRRSWPYGEDIGSPSPSERIRFASMERDAESTTYHDHARHYELTFGRFLSPDRIGGRQRDPQSWNRYIYGCNNPINRVDPNGLFDLAAFASRFASASTLLSSAWEHLKQVPIIRPYVTIIGARAGINFLGAHGEAGVDFSVKADALKHEVKLEASVDIKAGASGREKGMGAQASITLARNGEVLPEGLKPEVTGSLARGDMSVTTDSELTVKAGLEEAGFEVGADLKELGEGFADLLKGLGQAAVAVIQVYQEPVTTAGPPPPGLCFGPPCPL